MDDDWESAADKEVVLRPKPTSDVNKWAGEDDDDDVKDSWEDEEEKKDEEKPEIKNTPSKKVTIAEKNELAAAKNEQAAAERLEEEKLANMTPEEKLAEKLRIQKIQEESDLKSALEIFGVQSLRSLDSYNPETKEEFKDFSSALSWKLLHFKESPNYTQFWEDLIRSSLASMAATELKKIKMCVENMHSEKVKLEKQSKKPAGKGKTRATIRTETDDIESYQNYGNDYEDYDDFM